MSVKLHGEGKHQREEVVLTGGEVEAENVLRVLGRSGFSALCGDLAKDAGFGGVGHLQDEPYC